ncbi:peptidoglycan bridge formation glycyltransferase FemA/FemB family protein [candidate division WS5 bacterium]|uniref:Peptidoglycan bridge formation glycyltransferase FemA/FemB family protein n=1 Tax=candidate division WS5 bacterium TaxID=2093353 RepID=A0A419DGP0_9BACT|nr:MAG: peptidoglycan bridge formation glycyltransferase FemA/FemB family protein [candidate division WS5 bacterium]
MGDMEALNLLSLKTNNIFQSDLWADFQVCLQRKSWIVKDDNIQGLVLRYPLYKDKYYLYSPRGPIMGGNAKLQDLKLFLRKVEALAKEENAVFYRIEPYLLDQSDIYKFGFRKMAKHAPLSAQFSPENTLVLDIARPEEKILADMKPKWRYNINLAKRKGVKVREGRNIKDIKIFYELTKEMEKRGGYKGHEYKYYEAMFKTLVKGDVLKLFIAEHEGKPLAAILVSYFGQVATYLHGASGNEKRELMPTYILQWTAIQEARNRRCRIYDFWGVAPEGEKNHNWAGISRFKRGFGGEELSFGGAYDLAFDVKYYKILSTANRFRKLIKK